MIDEQLTNKGNPLTFIDTVKTGNHIVLFYEELEYARILEFRFLGNGLMKGEHALYISDSDVTFIENEMEGAGIDVSSVKKNNLLNIFSTSDPNDVDALAIMHRFVDKMTVEVQSPYRVVSKPFRNVSTVDGILAQLETERYWHAKFGTMRCALLCSHYVKQIEDNRRGKWISELLKLHHGAIFAPDFGKGLGYYKDNH